MNRILRLLIVLLVALYSPACTRAPPVGRPQLVLESSEVDLGEISRGAPRTAITQLWNRGTAPLEITLLETSCKCTAAKISRQIIPPHGQAELEVAIKVDGPGPASATVMLHTNSQGRSVSPLTFRWVGISPLEFSPLTIDLGSVSINSVHEKSISIIRRPELLKPGTELRLVRAGSNQPNVAVQVPLGPVHAQLDALVVVTADDGVGKQEGVVEFEFEGSWSGLRRVPVRWTVSPPLVSIPPRIFLGRVRSGEDVRGVVELRSVEGKLDPSTLLTTVRPDWLVVNVVSSHDDQTAQIELTGRLPEASDQVVKGELVVKYDTATGGVVRVPISVIIKE